MEIEELGRYTDAIACLELTLKEGRKNSNVDIRLMLSNIQRCQVIIQELLSSEHESYYSRALSGLVGSLSVHEVILQQKIDQLNQAMTPATPKTTSTMFPRNVTPQRPDTPIPTRTPCNATSISCEPTATVTETEDDYEKKMSRSREKMIESTIVKSGAVRFDDVIGLSEAKRSLHDAIIMPLDFPHLFSGGRKPWRRILLYGPPGTGKTRLAQAVSSEVHATFYAVSSGDLISSLIGESEKSIKELFHHACSQQGQSIIFIDEIDSLCRLRNSREDDGTRRIKTELLIQMEAAERREQTNIFLLCATNCPWDLDKAFLRRFQKRIYIPLPDSAGRIDMMKLHCRGNAVDIPESAWGLLASKTEGYSGSDLSTLTNGALFQPIRDLQAATLWRRSKEGNWTPVSGRNKQGGIKAKITDFPPEKVCPRDVTLEDFLGALKLHSPTVPAEELEKFTSFTASFGQSG